MTDITLRKTRTDRALFALLLVLAAAAFAWTFTFPPPVMRGYPGAALFPQIILTALALFSLSGLWRNYRIARAQGARTAKDGDIHLRLGALAATVTSLAAFVAVLEYAGMEPAVFLYLAGVLYVRTRRPFLALACGFFGAAGVYLLFVQAIDVHLPLLFLPRYLGWW